MKTLNHIRVCWYLFFLLIMLPPVRTQEKSSGFKFGIAWDDITQNDSYDHFASLGTDVIRLSGQNAAFWGLIEPKIGEGYNFASLDNLVGETYGKGIEIMAIILAIHPTENKRTPTNYDAYNKFVKAVVERYDGDGYNDAPGSPIVKYWQVDNEPNSPGWNDTAANYAKLVQNTYESAKEVNQNCKIILGGAMAGEEDYVDWEGFYETVLQEFKNINPGKEFFDMVDFHYYRRAFGEYRNIKDIFNRFNSLLQNYGYNNKEFVITETGTHTGKPISGLYAGEYQSEKDQARDLLKRYVLSMSLGIKQAHWFRLKEKGSPWSPNGQEGNVFSLVPLIFNGLSAYDPGDGIKKLAYHTYKLTAEKLKGFTDVQTVQEEDNIYIYKFTKQGKPIWVAWNDSSVTRTITIDGISSNRVKATEAVPRFESGQEVVDYNTAFGNDTLAVTDGTITLTLGATPVFIEPLTQISAREEGQNIQRESLQYQNYPPSNPTTQAGVYSLSAADGQANSKVYEDPSVAGIAVRTLWETLEPAEGQFNWGYLDNEIQKAANAGKKVSLSIAASSRGTPDWVYAAGAQPYRFIDQNPNHPTYGDTLTMPLPWDSVYIAKWTNFIRALGSRYANNTTISYIRGSSEIVTNGWGLPETDAFGSSWSTHGYTPDKLLTVMTTVLDALMIAFPQTAAWVEVGTIKFEPQVSGRSQTYVAERIAEYGFQTYPGRFGVWREDISGCIPNPPTGGQWKILWDHKGRNGAQMLWNVQDGPTRMNKCGITPNEKATVLKAAVQTGLDYGMPYLEIYQADVLDTALASVIQFAAENLGKNVAYKNSPLGIFSPYEVLLDAPDIPMTGSHLHYPFSGSQ